MHSDGVCPYAALTVEAATEKPATTETKTSNITNNTAKSKASKSDIKKVQEALNLLGYDCGTPDGVCGKTTKKRIKEFQEDIGVTVDGVVDEELMEALGV